MNHNPIHGEPHRKKDIDQAELERLKRLEEAAADKSKGVNKTALIYETMAQLLTLASACHDVAPISGAKGGELSASQSVIQNSSDPVGSLSDFLKSFNDKEYMSNPKAFYHKVLMAVADIAEIKSPPVQNMLLSELKSRLGPIVGDLTHQRPLGLVLGDVYKDASGGSTHTSLLQECLAILFQNSPTVVDSTLSTYKNSLHSNNPLPDIKRHHKQLAVALSSAHPWQNHYDHFLTEMDKHKFSVKDLLLAIKHIPKGCEHQKAMLAKWLGPILTGKESQKNLAEALCFHFAQEKTAQEAHAKLKDAANDLIAAMPHHLHRHVHQVAHDADKGLGAVHHTKGKHDHHSLKHKEHDAAHKVGSSYDPNYIHHVIHNAPIMMALYIVLMSSQGVYGYLAQIMSQLNGAMGDVKKFNDLIQEIENDLNSLMNGKGDPKQIAQDLQKAQAGLEKLLHPPPSDISKDLLNSIESYAGTNGTLNKVVQEATQGMKPPCNTWQDAANNPAALQKIKAYLNNEAGGPAGKAASGIFSATSNLVGALNTQNQADVEKLNLTTKKVDSMTKLFAAAITLYKGITQSLTNFSGS